MMKNFFVILAAGKSQRLNSKIPKPYLSVNNKSLIQYSIDVANKCKNISNIAIVYNKIHKKLLNNLNLKNIIKIEGGKTRAESTFNALKFIKKFRCINVLIHDAARPNITVNIINKIIKNLKKNKAVIPCLKIKDSVKSINTKKRIKNLNRKQINITQTPQGFRFGEIYKLNKNNFDINVADDASLFINHGKKLKFINGEENNFKITTKNDFVLFKKLKIKKNKYGIGFDVHRLEKGIKLYLGGIKIPYHSGLKGHSDGDVIIHAIIDALMGACRLKDIGTLFSNKNKKYKNIRSPKMLNKVLGLINQKRYLINNIDINVITERPRIDKYRNKIINSISKLCNIDKNKINIKGKTTEKLGLIGKEKAIAAEAITSVYKYD